jgi:putative Holliday junction resolvase
MILRILAVDYGDVRTGLAISDVTETLASPVGVIREKSAGNLIHKIVAAVKERGAELIIVGNPVNMNGSLGPRSEQCARFAEALRGAVDVPVELWDERTTTIAANNLLNETNIKGRKRKEIIDAAAAAVLLENYLTYRKNRER